MKEIQSLKEFTKDVMKYRKIIIEVYIPNCGWSQRMMRFLEEKEEGTDKRDTQIAFLKLNASNRYDNEDIQAILNMLQLQDNRRYPVTFFIKDRKLWEKVNGGPDGSNRAAFDSFFTDFENL